MSGTATGGGVGTGHVAARARAGDRGDATWVRCAGSSSPFLAGDVAAVIRSVGEERAVVVGHDWGGAVAWMFAMRHPEMTERLVILNTPHPRGLLRELRTNPQQRANSQYARVLETPAPTSR